MTTLQKITPLIKELKEIQFISKNFKCTDLNKRKAKSNFLPNETFSKKPIISDKIYLFINGGLSFGIAYYEVNGKEIFNVTSKLEYGNYNVNNFELEEITSLLKTFIEKTSNISELFIEDIIKHFDLKETTQNLDNEKEKFFTINKDTILDLDKKREINRTLWNEINKNELIIGNSEEPETEWDNLKMDDLYKEQSVLNNTMKMIKKDLTNSLDEFIENLRIKSIA